MFLSLLETRTRGAWRLAASDRGPDFVVEIHERSNEKIGRVWRPSHAGDGAREIIAADCRDLVQALALSTAVSFEEERAAATPAATIARAAPPRGTTSEASTWLVGAGLQTSFLIPSQPMAQASLLVENGHRLWSRGLGFHRPDVRLEVAYARNDLLGGDRARFALASASLTVCPVGVGLTAKASVRVCGAGEIGMLSGEGVAVGTPQTTRFLWGGAGGVIRLRWAPGNRVVLEAQASATGPLERTTFVFEMPRVEVAKVAPLVISGGLTLGFAIP